MMIRTRAFVARETATRGAVRDDTGLKERLTTVLKLELLYARIELREAMEDAAKTVSKLAADAEQADLVELLREAPREAYSFQNAGWPSDVVGLRTEELPGVVLERYNTRQSVCFCGVLPEISRAWASVDNSLFLWRLDVADDVPVEYSGEEQAIVAVGLVKPKAGVFLEAISYVLVIATTVELVMVGVCLEDGGRELTLHPLQYSCPTDATIMNDITSTPDGRIFLAGADESLYELVYAQSDTWHSKRCKKVRHSSNLSSMLPSVLRLKGSDALKQVIVDAKRGILYTRSEQGVVHVYDVGPLAKDAPRRVAEVKNVAQLAAQARGQGSLFSSATSSVRKGAKLVHIAIVTPEESSVVTLVAICADGRRIYLTSLPPSRGYSSRSLSGSSRSAPSRLSVVEQRDPPPQGGNQRGMTTAQALLNTTSRALEIEAGFYSSGVLLLSDATANDSDARLILSNRDLALPPHLQLPPPTPPPSSGSGTRGLREVVTLHQLDGRCASSLGSLGEIPLPKSVQEALEPPYPAGTLPEARVTTTGLLSELVTQYVCPRRRFVLMTNAGLVRFEKARPIDILRSLLEKNIPEQIEEFFKSYGPIEAAAMCVALAVSGAESNAIILAAKRAFDDPRLTGEPTIVEDSYAQNQENNGGSFNMGRAIVQPILTFSSAQRGLFLFTARIMSSTWERPIIVPVRAPAQTQFNSNARPTSPAMMIANKALGAVQAAARYMSEEPALVCSMDATLLATLQDRLLPLVTFLRQRRPRISSGVDMSQNKRRRVRSSGSEMTALQEEERSLSALSAMVSRTAQALSLISIVIADERFSRVADMLPSAIRKELSQLTLKRLVSTQQGARIASALIEAMMSHIMSHARHSAEALATDLQKGCPDFFGADSRTFYHARDLLQLARDARARKENVVRDKHVNDAIALFMKVPTAGDLSSVCAELVDLRAFHGVTAVPLAAAAALEARAEENRFAAGQSSVDMVDLHACFDVTCTTIRGLATGKSDTDAEPGSLSRVAAELPEDIRERGLVKILEQLQRVSSSDSQDFMHRVFAELIHVKRDGMLLSLPAAMLEPYLVSKSALTTAQQGGVLTPDEARHLDLLAQLYAARSLFGLAAQVDCSLAERRCANDEIFTLDQRMALFERALMHARKSVDGGNNGLDMSFSENVDSKIKLLDMQRRVLGVCVERSRQARAAGSGNAPEEAFVYELERELKQLSDLYNDFAKPCELWDICLEMVHFSQYHDPDGEIACDLWDKLLLQAADRAPSATTCLREACIAVRALGVKLFPSDVAFPVVHVALRLELMAAGIWGVPDAAVDTHADEEFDTGEVADALVGACKGLAEPVQRAYDRLLATPAQRMHDKRLSKVDALQTPRMRLRLLRSVFFVLQLWDQSLVPKSTAYGSTYATGGHVRAAIGDLCVSYASECRRMQYSNERARTATEELAAAFDTFGRRLLS